MAGSEDQPPETAGAGCDAAFPPGDAEADQVTLRSNLRKWMNVKTNTFQLSLHGRTVPLHQLGVTPHCGIIVDVE